MLEKNLFSTVNSQVEPEVAAGRTSFIERNMLYDSRGFWCSGMTTAKVPLLKSTLAGAENIKFLILSEAHIIHKYFKDS